MNRGVEARIMELLVEIGGRAEWVLLWDGGEHAQVDPRDVPEVICGHLLRLLRGELGPHNVIMVEH